MSKLSKYLQNQDAAENPEKYQMKAHFLLSSVLSQRNPPHNYKLLLLASMHRYIRTAPSPPASKHECHPLGKHSSSMQTVEVFVKPGYSREPRKIPNESPFSAEFRGI
jgi:hypothetical protein